MATVTLDSLKARFPQFAPLIDQYGPTLLSMTQAEIWAWIQLATKGDPYVTYKAILDWMPASADRDEWDKNAASWSTLNAANVDSIAWQKKAISAVLSVVLTIALAAVGL